ncbi:helix-turn-helix transcriptional regulator [Mycolicibacterium sp. XJ879]
MNITDRCSVVQTRVDAAGVGWVTSTVARCCDLKIVQRDTLEALAELLGDPAVRTIIVAGLPLAVLTRCPHGESDSVDVDLAEKFRQIDRQLWNSSKTLVIRRHVEGAAPTATSEQPAYIEPLTERELEVLALACEGASAREIGERLFISERTVESHVSNAYRKLGIRSRIELIRRATQFGF